MTIHKQIKHRRRELKFHQKDMQLRIGMNRQQYQQIEAGGNPSLSTLELIAKGLNSELILIPNESLRQVKEILHQLENKKSKSQTNHNETKVSDDPWKDILE